ncbi:MAG TPA: haloacid dehalogenase type II [Terriglobales bacterium]|jgi:2-haloacid dehalogenase|nr:haloacid dehalogenase type II [Terriglobales bacterium]
MLDFTQFRAITFDCYGTLVDWESGIFGALRPVLAAHDRNISDERLLELYAEFEGTAQQGEYRRYRDVLRSVVQSYGQRLKFTPSDEEIDSLAESVPRWKPFPDTVAALKRLAERYRLFIISNIDDDLFAATRKHLGIDFDGVVTAEQARSYKPSINNFKLALEKLRLPVQQVLHAGQSVFHDVLPARSLGMKTVWVNRPSPRPNAGAARAAAGTPDLEVKSMAELAALAVD